LVLGVRSIKQRMTAIRMMGAVSSTHARQERL
jgi:hypothetical protein